VGCKELKVTPISGPDEGFTLTMWDVKFLILYVNWHDFNSFTLTMWDVKSTAALDEAHIKESFTLTMWDVKVVDSEESSFTSVFYLNYVGCKEVYY